MEVQAVDTVSSFRNSQLQSLLAQFMPLLGVVIEHLLTYQSASPRNPEDSCGVSYVHRHSLENLLYAKLRVYFLWEPNL